MPAAQMPQVRRELLTPVLVLAALCLPDCRLKAQDRLSGSLGNGVVDFSVRVMSIYRWLLGGGRVAASWASLQVGGRCWRAALPALDLLRALLSQAVGIQMMLRVLVDGRATYQRGLLVSCTPPDCVSYAHKHAQPYLNSHLLSHLGC